MLADGRGVKLAGIDVPRADALSSLNLAGRRLVLQYEGTRIDRYGRALAFVMPEGGQSLQERLIAGGLARVTPSRDMRLCSADLLAAEARARADSVGIWSEPAFAVRRADDLAGLAPLDGSYQLVEGVVRGFSKIRGRLYFNFGDDWREDFTVTVTPADAKLFSVGAWGKLTGKKPAIVGAKVRVRGFLSRYNGPGMAVAVPEQIELLDIGLLDIGLLDSGLLDSGLPGGATPDERKKAANEDGGRKVSAKARRD